MPCEHVTLPGGQHAIVCTGRGGGRKCVVCKRPATRLCDWKVPEAANGTCSTPLCARHSHRPAPDKDLCPQHSAEWIEMRQKRLEGHG